MKPHLIPLALTSLLPFAAPLAAQIVDRSESSWAPDTFGLRTIVAADLDADLRDDAVFLRQDGSLLRAVNPGHARGFFPFGSVDDAVDVAAIRRAGDRDLVVTVGPQSGLVLHGVRPNGSDLSAPSTTTAWHDVERLRVFDAGRFPIVAGIIAGGTVVRLAALDSSTLSLSDLGIRTFPSALLDLEIASAPAAAYPHLVGLTPTSVVRLEFDGSTRSVVDNLQIGAGAMVRLPGGHEVAVVHRASAVGTWTLQSELDGVWSRAVPLEFEDPLLLAMKVRDIDAGFLDDDEIPDLLVGQSIDGRAVVLFGDEHGHYAPQRHAVLVPGAKGTAVTTSDDAPPVVARVDGTLRDGVFHASDAERTLVVHHRVSASSGGPTQRSSDIVPSVVGEPQFEGNTNGADRLHLVLRIPALLREWAAAEGLDALQITVWSLAGVVDIDGKYTPQSAVTELAMRGDVYWSLPDLGASAGDIDYEIACPVPLSLAEYEVDRKHVILMVRLARVETAGTLAAAVEASFSTPLWFTKHWEVTTGNGTVEVASQLFEAPELATTVFDPQDPPVEVKRITGISKKIGRLIRARPLPPPMEGPPSTVPLVRQGAAQQPQ